MVVLFDAFVPLENMFGYSTDMRSLSSGRADYSMTPSHFDQVPQILYKTLLKHLLVNLPELIIMNGHKIRIKLKRIRLPSYRSICI
jgi:translation elongation factor EF-G